MQLLDDNLWGHFLAGRISAEEAIDKSKNPGGMVDRMKRHGIDAATDDEGLLAEADEQTEGGAAPGAPASAQSEADRQSQIAANRARMAAQKK
jgi:hypothetical protein